jgi:hypothetical protein
MKINISTVTNEIVEPIDDTIFHAVCTQVQIPLNIFLFSFVANELHSPDCYDSRLCI